MGRRGLQEGVGGARQVSFPSQPPHHSLVVARFSQPLLLRELLAALSRAGVRPQAAAGALF